MDSVMAAASRELSPAATGTTLEFDPRMSATLGPGVLVERDAELARIAGRLGAARRGEGGVLVIEGEAGIGKTSLVRALRERAAAEGMQVMHARGAELESSFAFGVLRQALARPVADLDPPTRAAVLSGHAQHATALLDPAAPGATGEAVLQGAYWLVANLAERGPLVLVVDDAQWADAPSIAALGFLARRTDQLPVVLVVATRPPDVDAQPELARIVSDPAAEVVRPRPLGEAAIAALSGSDDGAFLGGRGRGHGRQPVPRRAAPRGARRAARRRGRPRGATA
jgi:hypothetical protein